MARSEYVERRLAEIGRRPKGAYLRPVPHIVPHKPRVKRYLPIPRPETIDRIGRLYVQHIRISYADREATWLDVAKAYADGWKDAECIIPSHRPGHSARDEHGPA